MRTRRRGRIPFIVVCAVISIAPTVIEAQVREAATQSPIGALAISLERRLAEQDLRALPMKLRERRQRAIADPKTLKQMNEDFVRIQTIRMDMVQTFSRGGVVEPGILKDLSAEVKRRASRLRSMLALSEEADKPGPKGHTPKTIESLNDQAYNLCIEISRFTENPIFKSKGAITARHASEADKTLGLVVSLAGSLQKASSNLAEK